MTNLNIAHLRLINQHITQPKYEKPGEVVAWLGAVQAQDYLNALWAVGLRTQQAIEADVEKALADKTIVRTWPMRGTLHFVAAADVRWMLKLLTPRVVKGSARRLHLQMGLDEATFTRSKKLFARALQGGKQLTRKSMYDVLEAGGVSAAEQRGLHILSRLAQDGFLCFGAREGKQPTFTLLDEWVPSSRVLARDEALAELALRYFTSHGPATLKDFVWWSGLTVAEAQAGLAMAKSNLIYEVFDEQPYWFSPSVSASPASAPTTYLLPSFDEYTVAYRDRSAVLNSSYSNQVITGNGIFYPIVVVDGQIHGTWKRTLKNDTLMIELRPFAKLNRMAMRALKKPASHYGDFLDAAVVLMTSNEV